MVCSNKNYETTTCHCIHHIFYYLYVQYRESLTNLPNVVIRIIFSFLLSTDLSVISAEKFVHTMTFKNLLKDNLIFKKILIAERNNPLNAHLLLIVRIKCQLNFLHPKKQLIGFVRPRKYQICMIGLIL